MYIHEQGHLIFDIVKYKLKVSNAMFVDILVFFNRKSGTKSPTSSGNKSTA